MQPVQFSDRTGWIVNASRIASSRAGGLAIALAVSVGFVCLVASTERAGPPPGDLWAAQTGPNVVTLAWRRPEKVSEFRIYEVEGGAFKRISALRPSADSFTHTVRPPWGDRQYAIDAVFEDGSVSEKALFNQVRVEEAKPGPVFAPASVTAEQTGPGEVTVRWSEAPGATAFLIGRSVGTGGLQMVCRLCPTTGRFVDRTPQPGVKHTYFVTTLAAGGASRRTMSNVLVPTSAPAAARAEPASAPPSVDAGFIAEPRPGGCLSLGGEGNLLVRLADGSVQFYERVRSTKNGLEVLDAPAFRRVDGITDAVAVAESGTHRLVLRRNGTILAWGENSHGQVGSERAIGRKFGRAFPADVETPLPVDGISRAVDIAVGASHSVALLADGTIRTWGLGDRGVPGDDRMEVKSDRISPSVVTGIRNAADIVAGGEHTFALLLDRTVRGWGSGWSAPGYYSLLGVGRDGDSAVPLPVVGLAEVRQVATSALSAIVLLADGTVKAWGTPTGFYQPERTNWMNSKLPVTVPGIRDAVAVSPHLILLADGTVREITAPEKPVPGVAGVVAVASSGVNRYALLEDGRLLGWGHPRFWPKGVVTVLDAGRQTAQACAMR
ncbi:MAG: hypothetical protein EHM71_11730 [Zetaproteobacteria bacterium]|nr:MAG: hypothetical protein EHM71_11730 [Zetaproteobacteria bacterium]